MNSISTCNELFSPVYSLLFAQRCAIDSNKQVFPIPATPRRLTSLSSVVTISSISMISFSSCLKARWYVLSDCFQSVSTFILFTTAKSTYLSSWNLCTLLIVLFFCSSIYCLIPEKNKEVPCYEDVWYSER